MEEEERLRLEEEEIFKLVLGSGFSETSMVGFAGRESGGVLGDGIRRGRFEVMI